MSLSTSSRTFGRVKASRAASPISAAFRKPCALPNVLSIRFASSGKIWPRKKRPDLRDFDPSFGNPAERDPVFLAQQPCLIGKDRLANGVIHIKTVHIGGKRNVAVDMGFNAILQVLAQILELAVCV